jgi:DNA anti-recombination protein RmuC
MGITQICHTKRPPAESRWVLAQKDSELLSEMKGALTQIDKRLDSMQNEINQLHSEMIGLRNEINGIYDKKFAAIEHWMQQSTDWMQRIDEKLDKLPVRSQIILP